MNYICYICNNEWDDRKEYISHVKNDHGEFINKHILIHKYGGRVPVCLECGKPVVFNEKRIDFNKYCIEHKRLAQIEWSQSNGFGAKVDKNQNLGKTKENCDYMKKRSERMVGVGVKKFSEEEKKEQTIKRLATEERRGSRRLKIEIWEKWCVESLRRGMKVLTNFSEIKTLKDPVRFKCELCGMESVGLLLSFCQNQKEQTFGCSQCTRHQIGEINSEKFRISEERWNELLRGFESDLFIRVLTEYKDYKNRNQRILVECLKCGAADDKIFNSLINGNKCYHCSKQGKSQWETEVKQALEKSGVNVIEHFKIGRKEIDLIVENNDKRVGVELNGLYWHSEKEKHKNYHKEKHELAAENGLQLLQFFEDEWRDKKEIVLSMILARIGVCGRIGARECRVVFPTKEEGADFFEKNHLAGGVRNDILRVGLEYNGELVELVSFRRPFLSKYGGKTIEIARFATKIGRSVAGGFSKIMAQAEKMIVELGYNKILTYSDKRTGTGKVYEASGFECVGDTAPDYFYTDFNVRYNRFKYRAKEGLTEAQVAEKYKVVKIYGVGSRVFAKSC